MRMRLGLRLFVPALLSLAGLSLATAKEKPAPDTTRFEPYANELTSHLNECNEEFLVDALDVDTYIERIVGGRLPEGEWLEGFRSGLRKSTPQSLLETCKQIVTHGKGQFKLLRVRVRDGHPVALYRIISEQGLNYLEFLVAQDEEGGFWIEDYFVATVGSWISEQIYMLSAPSFPSDTTESPNSESIRGVMKLASARTLVNAGQPGEAMKLLDSIPDSIRNTPSGIAIRIGVAQSLGDETYRKVLAEVAPLGDSFPGLNLILLDHYFYEENWSAVENGLARLEAEFGPDSYLEFLRGSLDLTRGNFEQARKAARRALAIEPGMLEPNQLLLTVSLEAKDHPETARLLQLLESKYGFATEDLVLNEMFSAFTDSEEYQKLIEAKNTPEDEKQPAEEQ